MLLLGSMFTAYSAANNLEQTPILGLGNFELIGITYIPLIYAAVDPVGPKSYGQMLLSLNATSTVFWSENCTNWELGRTCFASPTYMYPYFRDYMAMDSSPLTNFTTPSIGIDGFSYWG